ARALLARLQDDARRLRELPRVPAPLDLSTSVLAALAKKPRRPLPVSRPHPRPSRFPVWTGWAAAAALLPLVGLGPFLYYSPPQPHAGPPGARPPPAAPPPPKRRSPPFRDLAQVGPEPRQDPEDPPVDPVQPGPGSIRPDRDPEQMPENPPAPKKVKPKVRRE